MAVTLSETAASRVKTFLDNRGKGIGLRLGVKTTGCSGMAYVLEFVDDLNEEDHVFESHGVKVIIDTKSMVY
ncbi:TPA: iron-sulfur cluster assembly accessory protein, partial [Vibrio cholerae]